MPAYLIADIEVTDPTAFEQYRSQVPATIAAHGGRYLVRGGATQIAEGTWQPKRVIVLEFPTMQQLQGWYNSPEYQKILPLRLNASKGNAVMVEGV